MAADSIRTFILSEFRDLQHRCSDATKATKEESLFLGKCMEKCQGVTMNFPKTISGGQISYYLQQYAEAMLDFTYHDETLLVDEEFPEKDAKDRVASIFSYFDKIRAMCDKISSGRRPEELLGNEIAECLLWRRGALLYMYCSTLQENKQRRDRDIAEYRKNLQKGIHYLQGMFKIRDPVLNTTNVSGDSDTLHLLKMGIYSESHLLALMYGGEMCHWFLASSDERGDGDKAAQAIGMEMLTTYVQAIEQLPELKAWNTSRAKELLTIMKDQKR